MHRAPAPTSPGGRARGAGRKRIAGCLVPDRGAYVETQLDVAPRSCTHLFQKEEDRSPRKGAPHDRGLHSYATILQTPSD